MPSPAFAPNEDSSSEALTMNASQYSEATRQSMQRFQEHLATFERSSSTASAFSFAFQRNDPFQHRMLHRARQGELGDANHYSGVWSTTPSLESVPSLSNESDSTESSASASIYLDLTAPRIMPHPLGNLYDEFRPRTVGVNATMFDHHRDSIVPSTPRANSSISEATIRALTPEPSRMRCFRGCEVAGADAVFNTESEFIEHFITEHLYDVDEKSENQSTFPDIKCTCRTIHRDCGTFTGGDLSAVTEFLKHVYQQYYGSNHRPVLHRVWRSARDFIKTSVNFEIPEDINLDINLKYNLVPDSDYTTQ